MARLSANCTSFSQVKPMAPNSCRPCRNTTAWHSPAAALAIADASRRRRRVVGGDGQRGEVRECPCSFDGHVHVDGLVLHGLERPDRHTELLPLLDVFEGQIEDPLAGPTIVTAMPAMAR